MRMRIILGLLVAAGCFAVVLDRIAVTVDNEAITESEVLRELRIAAFLNGEPLDFSPEARRAAAERLVDQALIRREMALGHYRMPDKREADRMLEQFKKSHGYSEAAFQQALKKYGITEEEVKAHLLWQLAALRFTDSRFQMLQPAAGGTPAAVVKPAAIPPAKAVPAAPTRKSSRSRQNPGTPTSNSNPAISPPANVDQQLEAWLKDVRSQARIEFKKAAFE
jgi:hypothetical protein